MIRFIGCSVVDIRLGQSKEGLVLVEDYQTAKVNGVPGAKETLQPNEKNLFPTVG